eukprot:g7339.t1
MEGILRDRGQLADERQKEFVLGPTRKDLENGKGETGDDILDDQNLLFRAPRRKLHAIALQRRLLKGWPRRTGSLHIQEGRIPLFIAAKYHWPSLKKDVWRYVESCRYRMKKRPWRRQLRILPAGFQLPWQVLELDILDMKTVTAAIKFLLEFPPPMKDSVGVSG